MSTDYLSDVPISSEDRFHAALTELLVAATREDVDVTGPWECHSDAADTDWETVIVELDNCKSDGDH